MGSVTRSRLSKTHFSTAKAPSVRQDLDGDDQRSFLKQQINCFIVFVALLACVVLALITIFIGEGYVFPETEPGNISSGTELGNSSSGLDPVHNFEPFLMKVLPTAGAGSGSARNVPKNISEIGGNSGFEKDQDLYERHGKILLVFTVAVAVIFLGIIYLCIRDCFDKSRKKGDLNTCKKCRTLDGDEEKQLGLSVPNLDNADPIKEVTLLNECAGKPVAEMDGIVYKHRNEWKVTSPPSSEQARSTEVCDIEALYLPLSRAKLYLAGATGKTALEVHACAAGDLEGQQLNYEQKEETENNFVSSGFFSRGPSPSHTVYDIEDLDPEPRRVSMYHPGTSKRASNNETNDKLPWKTEFLSSKVIARQNYSYLRKKLSSLILGAARVYPPYPCPEMIYSGDPTHSMLV